MKLLKIIFIISLLSNIGFIAWTVLSTFRVKVSFIGDSITESLPLHNNLVYTFENYGFSGFTSYDALKSAGKVARRNPRRLFIQIGVNDLEQKIAADSVIKNFDKIILTIHNSNPSTSIIVSSLFPTGRKYSYLNAQIKRYNSMLKTYCIERGIRFIDEYPSLLKGNEINENYSNDGMHLSKDGYKIWIDSMSIYF